MIFASISNGYDQDSDDEDTRVKTPASLISQPAATSVLPRAVQPSVLLSGVGAVCALELFVVWCETLNLLFFYVGACGLPHSGFEAFVPSNLEGHATWFAPRKALESFAYGR